MIIKGRKIVGGIACAEALVSRDPISFYGGIDPVTGEVIEKEHNLEGKQITGKIFIFPTGKGSTVGSYVIYRMKKLGTAPAAIINLQTEAIIATGCVISSIPLVDKIDQQSFMNLKTGMAIRVDGDQGLIEIISDH